MNHKPRHRGSRRLRQEDSEKEEEGGGRGRVVGDVCSGEANCFLET